jgi:hypothetical protein
MLLVSGDAAAPPPPPSIAGPWIDAANDDFGAVDSSLSD